MYKEPKFYNQSGELTAYSFACGYVEHKENDIAHKKLFKDSVYHVQYGKNNEQLSIWESFEPNELTKARKFYKSIKI